ncbi:hypothetical protein KBC55_03065 [Patescibacteria group bacterium]|nr:hypothetical protein [Patescibacteria group bacterium]
MNGSLFLNTILASLFLIGCQQPVCTNSAGEEVACESSDRPDRDAGDESSDFDENGEPDGKQYHLAFTNENGQVASFCGRNDLFGYSEVGYLVGYGLSGEPWVDEDEDCDNDGVPDSEDPNSACGDWVTSAVEAYVWEHAGETWRCANLTLEGPHRVNFRALNDLDDTSRLEWAEVPNSSQYYWQDQFARGSACFLFSDGEVLEPGPTTCDHTF